MFEHRSQRLISKREFVRRQVRYGILATTLILLSWGIGIAGYAIFENMTFLDAVLNAAMILGGMGPVAEIRTNGGKIFASFYAVFAGIGFLGAFGVFFAPAYHRFLHRFQQEVEGRSPKG